MHRALQCIEHCVKLLKLESLTKVQNKCDDYGVSPLPLCHLQQRGMSRKSKSPDG